jgi:hypothetical protein
VNFSDPKKYKRRIYAMDQKKGPDHIRDFRSAASAEGDPRRDVIESGPLRGRRAATLGMVRVLRQDAAALARELVGIEGLRGSFARERVGSIEHTLRILERVARLPADPTTDYTGLGTP